MKQNSLTIILLGRSGSGKGTQADLIAKRYKHIRYISTGDLFRSMLETEKHSISQKTKEIVNSGGLPPSWLASFLWTREIINTVQPRDTVIFDGAPRRLPEARLLDEVLGWSGRKGIPILIDISSREAFRRLSERRMCKECKKIFPFLGKFKNFTYCDVCGGLLIKREDDDAKAIKSRQKWFTDSVMPVVRYYKRQKRLKVVNGEQSIEKVHKDIVRILE